MTTSLQDAIEELRWAQTLTGDETPEWLRAEIHRLRSGIASLAAVAETQPASASIRHAEGPGPDDKEALT